MTSIAVKPRAYRWDRWLGVVFMLGGAVFLVIGLTGTGTPVDHLSKAADTHHHETILYMLGGISAVIAGVIVTFVRPMR